MVNGVAFVHGGLTPEVAALGCDGINAAVQRELGRRPGEDAGRTRRPTLAAGENGPLWYRGLAREDETALAPARSTRRCGRSGRARW